jgi:hypothetical protein
MAFDHSKQSVSLVTYDQLSKLTEEFTSNMYALYT